MTVEWTTDLVRHRTIADREAERQLYGEHTRSGSVERATTVRPPIFAAHSAGSAPRDERPVADIHSPLGGGAAPLNHAPAAAAPAPTPDHQEERS